MMAAISDWMWYALIATGIVILISAMDELFIDLVYWFRVPYRKWKMHHRRYEPLTQEKLNAVPEKRIAILIPAWKESLVIGDMLRHNLPMIHYKACDFFVGVYPNDPDTILEVKKVAKQYPQVHCVVGKENGPTNKGKNLNGIYAYILNHEKKHGFTYEILVLHDAEDVIHPLSFKLYNYLLPRKDMVQIPVLPLEISLWNFTHWVYNDEFAENHTKDLISREAIRGLVPSAGTGTAFSRKAIAALGEKNHNQPFTAYTYTEDYGSSLRLKILNLSEIFVSFRVERTQMKKRWIFFGPPVPRKIKELVATRSLFPTRYINSVRQKGRWIMGISLQEWAHSGWPGNLPVKYTLLHDRKSIFTHFFNVFGYVVFLYWIIYWIMGLQPSLETRLSGSWVWFLIVACTILMIERLAQRVIATSRIYGLWAGILSLPRAVYGNFLNMHAVLRAYAGFFFKPAHTQWAKTTNVFPSQRQLQKYKQRLGDLLSKKGIVTEAQIAKALSEQALTGEKLGTILLKQNSSCAAHLLKALAEQYHLEIVDISLFRILSPDELAPIPSKTYQWLLKNNMLPIAFERETITLAITNPADEASTEAAENKLKPFKIKFVLSSAAIQANFDKNTPENQG